jgi:RNA polymerase sigma-70 factor (ECF subfamily)
MIFILFSDENAQRPSEAERSKKNIKVSNPEEWVDHHGDYLYRIALLRVQDEQLANDMIQETFLAALKAHKSFKGKSTIRTWLVSILKRKIIDHYRKNSRLVSFQENGIRDPLPEYIDHGERAGRWKMDMAPSDWGKNPLKALEQQEFLIILQNCLNSLQKNLAIVFTLREIDQKDSQEICKELNISTSNLWVMLHRSRTQLRRCLEKNWYLSKK